MPTTWIDVVDNVVKIGLGAIVGGVSAFVLAMQKYRYDKKSAIEAVDVARSKERRDNRRRLVEGILPKVEPFLRSHRHMIYVAWNEARRKAEAADRGAPLNTEQLEKSRRVILKVGDLQGDYLKNYYDAEACIAILHLAAAGTHANSLNALLRGAMKERDLYLGSESVGKVPDKEKVQEHLVEFTKRHRAFTTALGTFYDEM